MNSVVSVSDDISGSDGETVKEESQDKIFDETIFILFVVTLISAILLFTVYFVDRKKAFFFHYNEICYAKPYTSLLFECFPIQPKHTKDVLY